MNKVILKGRLTHTPEVRVTKEGGKSVTKFSVAVDRRFNREKTDFINCEAWGATADFLGKYFKKGQEIAVVGELHIDKKEANGETKTYATVVVEEAYFCGGKVEEEPTKEPEPEKNTIQDDDLPF